MSILLRASRFVVALFVSLHVSILRLTTGAADRRVTKHAGRVEQAQAGLRFAQEAVRYARLNVREFRDAHTIASNDARNTRIAADAEAKFFGRNL